MLQVLPLPDAELSWAPAFLAAAAACAAFEALLREVPWETHRIRIFGREVDSPRLSCWIGDADARYTYSRTAFDPRPWTPTLLGLKAQVEAASRARFNSVLANRYRNGQDSMGWHSDDEPELGAQPTIASLSVGAPRRFALRHRKNAHPKRDIELPRGSLLLMRGETQRHWQHALPKTARAVGERINLTFRWINAISAPAPATGR